MSFVSENVFKAVSEDEAIFVDQLGEESSAYLPSR